MIEISHLTKKFNDKSGEVTALHDVNLSIGRGDVFGIIGMSGAGKSTLLRCLSTLEAPTSGTVTLDGVNLHTLSGSDLIRMRRRMGVVFQGYNLLMQRTVRQNVAFPLSLAGGDPAETARRNCSSWSGFRLRRTATPPSSRAGRSRGSRSHARSRPARRFCSVTSRPRLSTRSPQKACWNCSGTSTGS